MNSVILLIRDNIMKKKIERWSLGEKWNQKTMQSGTETVWEEIFC